MNDLVFQTPFESRKAAQDMRDQIIAYLVNSKLEPGSKFYSDADLVRLSGLSRKTVREALSSVQREGWIERRQGTGSFVGLRAGLALPPRQFDVSSSRRSMIRLAVLVYAMAGDAPDWYSSGVLRGLDEVSNEAGVSIELIGDYSQDAKSLSLRLMQSSPDVLMVMPAFVRHAYAVGEARRQGLPTLLTGTRFMDLGLPTVCEEGRHAVADAVKHLYDLGHRRIGLLQRQDASPWVFERRQGYLDGMKACGLECDERLAWWCSDDASVAEAELQVYLKAQTPTAVIATSGMLMQPLGALVQAGKVRVPEDLSVISFDQSYSEHERLLGLRPTIIELPLVEMGKALALKARAIMEGEESTAVTRLPCRIVEGQSTARICSE